MTDEFQTSPMYRGIVLAKALTIIKRETGLTWDKIGDLLSVSRKTCQNIMSGGPRRLVQSEGYLVLLAEIRREHLHEGWRR